MNNLIEILFSKCTDSWYNNITVYMRFEFDHLDLNISDIVWILVEWYPIMTLRVNTGTILKRFRRNLLKPPKKIEGTWWDGVGRVTWKIVNCSHKIYNGIVRKAKQKNPNSFGMPLVSISQFHSYIGWYRHRKVWHEMCDWKNFSSIFMKQQSRYSIKLWRSSNHQ